MHYMLISDLLHSSELFIEYALKGMSSSADREERRGLDTTVQLSWRTCSSC